MENIALSDLRFQCKKLNIINKKILYNYFNNNFNYFQQEIKTFVDKIKNLDIKLKWENTISTFYYKIEKVTKDTCDLDNKNIDNMNNNTRINLNKKNNLINYSNEKEELLTYLKENKHASEISLFNDLIIKLKSLDNDYYDDELLLTIYLGYFIELFKL